MTSEEAGNLTEVTFDLTRGDLARFRMQASQRRMPMLRWLVPFISIFVPLMLVSITLVLLFFGPGSRLSTAGRQHTLHLIAIPVLGVSLIFPLEGLFIIGIWHVITNGASLNWSLTSRLK